MTACQRQAVHFALGKAYDDVGDYAAAMAHVDAANRLRGAQVRFDQSLLTRQISQIISSTPAGFTERRPDLAIDDATPILIVGMPRSGTTLVEQILSSHPEVAAGGELGFWRQHSMAARRVAADYLAVLRAVSSDAARVIDKAPFNLFRLGAICQAFPRATIVHCRRHPVDTCLSIFATNFQIRYDFVSSRCDLVFVYREYQRMMAHWRSVLPADRFIEIDYETLVADPEPLVRRLVAACGLEWNDACLAPERNQRTVTTASLWQARRPIYRTSVERWRRYEPWLGELRELLEDTAVATSRLG